MNYFVWFGAIDLFSLFLGLVMMALFSLLFDFVFRRWMTSGYQEEIIELESTLSLQKNDLLSWQAQATEMTVRAQALEAEKQALYERVSLLESERDELLGSVETTQVRLRNLAVLEETNKTLHETLNVAEQQLQQAQEENAQLSEVSRRLEQEQLAWQEERKAIAQERLLWRDKSADLETELATLTALIKIKEEELADHAKLQSASHQQQQEMSQLQAQLVTTKGRADLVTQLETERNELQNRLQQLQSNFNYDQDQTRTLEQQLRDAHNNWIDAQMRIRDLERQLTQSSPQKQVTHNPPQEIPSPLASLSTTTSAPVKSDSLTKVKGIGKQYAQKLHQAGIHTFQQLAQASQESLQAIIAPQPWQNVDFAGWIAQAKQLLANGSTI